MRADTHKAVLWSVLSDKDGSAITLPGQPVSSDDGRNLTAGITVVLPCGLRAAAGVCDYIGKGVKTGIAAAPVK